MIFKLFKRRENQVKTEKILVIAPSFLGGGLLSVIFFRNLRYKYPDATIEVLSKEACSDIISMFPYVDKVHKTLNNKISDNRKFIKEQGYTKAYLMKRSFSAGQLIFNCGIKKVIGFNTQARRLFLTTPVKYKAEEKHEYEHFLDLLRVENIEIKDNHLEIFEDETAKANIIQKLAGDNSKKALIVASSAQKYKMINEEVFADVTKNLIAKGYSIYFIGLKNEKDVYENIKSYLSDDQKARTNNLCGELSLMECVSLVGQMDLVVGIDTGFCHIASAFNRPTLAIYGMTSLKQWHLLGENSKSFSLNLPCSPCKKPKKCKHRNCLKQITSDQIINEIETLLIKMDEIYVKS